MGSAHSRLRAGIDQIGQQLQRGIVGKVQVVQHQGIQHRQGLADHRGHGLAQGIGRHGGRWRGGGQFGQDRRQVFGFCARQGLRQPQLQSTQQASQGGVGHQGVTRAPGRQQQTGWAH